jgi:hypothetical protein
MPCSRLDIEKLSSGEEIQHHSSYGDLVASSQNGCGLCALIMKHVSSSGIGSNFGSIGNDEDPVKVRSRGFSARGLKSLQFYSRRTGAIEIGFCTKPG